MASHHHPRQHLLLCPSQYYPGQTTYVSTQSVIWQGDYLVAPVSASGALVGSYPVMTNGPQPSIGGGGNHRSYPHGSQQGVLAMMQMQSSTLVYAAPGQLHRASTPIHIGSGFVSSGPHSYDLRAYHMNTQTAPPAAMPDMQRTPATSMDGHMPRNQPHGHQVTANGVRPTTMTSYVQRGRVDGDAHLGEGSVDTEDRKKRPRRNTSGQGHRKTRRQ